MTISTEVVHLIVFTPFAVEAGIVKNFSDMKKVPKLSGILLFTANRYAAADNRSALIGHCEEPGGGSGRRSRSFYNLIVDRCRRGFPGAFIDWSAIARVVQCGCLKW